VKIEIPRPPKLREDGEYAVMVGKGYGDPRGTISLDEKWELTLDNIRVEDCDALIKAAAEIKEKVLAYRAELAVPHGRKHLYKGRCQLCGKPEDDELHDEPVLWKCTHCQTEHEAMPSMQPPVCPVCGPPSGARPVFEVVHAETAPAVSE
jgi:hypothetical protein